MLNPHLAALDSRNAALLMKQLASSDLEGTAWALFDWMKQQEEGSHIRGLCDVFLYTAMITLSSSLVGQQDNRRNLTRAFDLSREMVERGVERNVHTFSALMNVCIKGGDYQAALGVFSDMVTSGCQPNVVTYNTLIDLYGKTRQWGEAIRVLDKMRAEVCTVPVACMFPLWLLPCCSRKRNCIQ